MHIYMQIYRIINDEINVFSATSLRILFHNLIIYVYLYNLYYYIYTFYEIIEKSLPSFIVSSYLGYVY